MGDPTSSATAASSLSSLGMVTAVGSAVVQSQGTKATDDYKAAMLDQAAQYGDLKATQTNAQMTNNLNITLGNIDAVRAAAHTDPTSPTGAAVRDYAETTGTERKDTAVNSIMEQSATDEANAAYLRKAGSDALLAGWVTGGGDALSIASKALSGGGGPAGGSDPGAPLTGTAAFNAGGSAGAIY